MIKANAHFVDCANAGLTDVYNWSTPSSGIYTEYFVGLEVTPASDYFCVVKATNNSTIDTTFATAGYWGDTWVGGSGGTVSSRDAVQLDDGRILVPHNVDSETNAAMTMLNTDGSIDTTWGTNGQYITNFAMTVNKVLIDNDGNFHIFMGVAPSGTKITYRKLDSNGTFIGGLTAGVTTTSFNDAIWANSSKTRIIACGSGNFGIVPPDDVQFFAINPDTYSIDTGWAGNVSSGGYANFVWSGSVVYTLRLVSDGMLCHQTNTVQLFKIQLDGSGLDTTWGSSGSIDFSSPNNTYTNCRNFDVNGDDAYILTRPNPTTLILNHVDSDGVVTSQTITGAGRYTFTSIRCFNDQIILAGQGSTLQDQVEIWNNDLEKISGFDLAGDFTVTAITWVIADESTKDYTTGTQARTVRYTSDLSHLNGQTVQILSNGIVKPDEVVTAGAVSITATPLHVGLEFDSTLLPMKLDGEANVKRISKIILNVNNSVGGNYGRALTNMYSTVLKPTGDVMDVDGDLYTGHIDLPFDGAYDRSGDIYIQQNQCVPMRVVGIGIYLSKEDI